MRRRRVCVYAQQVYARVRATGMIRARATARTGARTHAHTRSRATDARRRRTHTRALYCVRIYDVRTSLAVHDV